MTLGTATFTIVPETTIVNDAAITKHDQDAVRLAVPFKKVFDRFRCLKIGRTRGDCG